MAIRLSLILFALLAQACNYEEIKNVPGGPSGKPNQNLGISFEDVRTEIFEARCTTCHAGYSNYETVVADIAEIRQRVATDNMPKGGPPLRAEQKAFLFAWIDGGAPRGAESPPPEEEDLVNFATIQSRILEPYCLRCHTTATDRNGNLALVDYNEVADEADEIWQAVNTDFMPLGGPPLPNELKDLLLTWVTNGAPQ